MSVATNLLPANTVGIETDASGWAAGANTTLARSTTRYYVGAASLRLTATAAGSVTATTSARVAVMGGTEYTAYAYFANVVIPTAGHTSTVTVSWYTAVTGGSAISTVSTSAALAASTAWNTPPPILIASAPGSANYASVTITVAGLASGAQVVADQISFGLPNVWDDNLLSYNEAGMEVDTSGWSVWQNATLDRSSATSWEGWYSLRLTSVAAGNAEARTGYKAVTEGSEFVGFIMVNAGVASDVRLDLRWYDSTQTFIATHTVTKSVPAGAWTRRAVTGVAPPGAAFGRLIVAPQATAAAQTWLFDQAGIRLAPLLPGNLLDYNGQSMEVDASAWEVESGCTMVHSNTRVWEGGYALEVTATSTADAVIRATERFPVTARQVYALTPTVYRFASAEKTVLDSLFTWYDADDLVIKSVYYRWQLSNTGGWFAPNSSAIAPAGAVTLSVGLRVVDPAAGEVFYVDNVNVAPGGLGVLADPIDGQYGVTVSIQGLTTGGYTYWGVWRMQDDGKMTPIRGATGDLSKQTITGDLAIVEDYEAQLGVSVRYYLKLWTSTSNYRALTSDAITLPEPPSTMVVLKDPGLPARQTVAVVARGGMPNWTRSARQGINQVRGRPRPIVISDVRTSRAGSMTLITETAQELADMWWLLETGNTLMIQWPSSWNERDVYVQVGEVAEAHVADYAGYADRSWTVPLTEVDRPIGGITGSALRTWEDVSTGHADWLDVMAAASNWLDVYTGVQGG